MFMSMLMLHRFTLTLLMLMSMFMLMSQCEPASREQVKALSVGISAFRANKDYAQ